MSMTLVRPEVPEATVGETSRVYLKRSLAVIALIFAAHLPLLLLQGQRLWDDPNYQFFPLILAGAGYLAWRNTRDLGCLEPGKQSLSQALIGVSWLLLAFAGLIIAPWLGAVVALVAVLAVAYAWGGSRLVLGLLPAWALLWVIVPLPFEDSLTLSLQTIASRWSSTVLDLIGVIHLPSGLVIEVPGQRLFVEEACSGIHSLFTVVAGTLFFIFLTRCSVVRALVLLAAAVVWVLLGNTARIVTVAWALANHGIDLTSGWPHELLGQVVLVTALILIVSTDAIYSVIALICRQQWALIVAAWNRDRRGAKAVEAAGPVTVVEETRPPEPTRLPEPARAGVGSWPVAMAYGGLALALAVWIWPCLKESFVSRGMLVSKLQSSLTADTLPARSGSLERVEFKTESRSLGNSLGEFSRSWQYRMGPHPVLASVDYPFVGWHELTICYRGQGWKLQRRRIRRDERMTFVEDTFTRASGEQGLLMFRLYDAEGRPVDVPDDPRLSSLSRYFGRLAVWREDARRDLRQRFSVRDQVQVFVPSPRPLTDEERQEARTFFQALCEAVHPSHSGGGA
jgi:exosortase